MRKNDGNQTYATKYADPTTNEQTHKQLNTQNVTKSNKKIIITAISAVVS